MAGLMVYTRGLSLKTAREERRCGMYPREAAPTRMSGARHRAAPKEVPVSP
jgi:hypothetical protein